MSAITATDRQKAKLVLLFSTLGLVGFLLNLLAGIGLWGYAGSRAVEPPTYDRFVGVLRDTGPAALPEFATRLFEQWSACETTRGGMTEVAIHALITASIVAIALFVLCLVLSAQLYQRLTQALGPQPPPQPPEAIDDTWKS